MTGTPTKLGRVWARLCDESVNWDAERDRVIDLPPFAITISETEGEHPVLEIAAENRGIGIYDLVGDNPRILISVDRLDDRGRRVDTVLMFDGRIDDTGSVEYGSEDIVLRYEAIRLDWEALRNALLANVTFPVADPCAGDISDPVERLDGAPTLVCWSRTTRGPVLSNAVIGGGGVHRDIGTRAIQGSVVARRNGKPLGRVDVTLSAEWTQQLIHEDDVGAMIDEVAGIDGLSTLTPESVGKDWVSAGDDVGGGYVASESDLELLDPPTGASDTVVIEQAASAARTFRPGAEQAQIVRLRKSYLRPTLRLAATSSIKRREEVRFAILNAGQGASTDVERLEIRLDNLALDVEVEDWRKDTRYPNGAVVRFAGFLWRCTEAHDSTDSLWIDRAYEDSLGRTIYRWEVVTLDGSPLGSPMAATYFNGPRGALSIDHAVAVATKMIAYSQRNWEIAFEVDPMEMLDISCLDTVRIVAPGVIPGTGSEAIGKIRSWTMSITAGQATLSVVLAVSSGSGTAGSSGGRTVAWHTNPVFRVSYSPPAYLAPYAPGIGVTKVEIVNGADEQIAYLQQAASEGRDLGRALDECKTGLRITTLPTGGGETTQAIIVNVSPYQGYRGISTRG